MKHYLIPAATLLVFIGCVVYYDTTNRDLRQELRYYQLVTVFLTSEIVTLHNEIRQPKADDYQLHL